MVSWQACDLDLGFMQVSVFGQQCTASTEEDPVVSHKTRQLLTDMSVKEVRVVRRNVVPKRFPEVMRVMDILQYI